MLLVRQVTDAVLAALLAPPCVCCGRVLDRPLAGAVCEACWSTLPRLPVPSACVSSRIARSTAIGEYEGTLRDDHPRAEVRRPPLGRDRAVADACRVRCELLADADAVVPVPLHRRRERERGFNQAHDLAAGLGRASLAAAPASARYAPAGGPAGARASTERARCVRADTAAAVAPGRSPSWRDRRARRRCHDDRRNARRVRERCWPPARTRCARLQQPESRTDRAEDGFGDGVLVRGAVDALPGRVCCLPTIALAHARQQREIAARSDRERAASAAATRPAGCPAAPSARAAAGGAEWSRATPRRAPALRRRRCSMPGSDRTRPRRPARSHVCDDRAEFVPIGDVEQLHDVSGAYSRPP